MILQEVHSIEAILYYLTSSEIHCAPVPVWDGLETDSTDTFVGAVVNVTCTQEGGQTASMISECDIYGEWEPALKSCESR